MTGGRTPAPGRTGRRHRVVPDAGTGSHRSTVAGARQLVPPGEGQSDIAELVPH